MNGSTALRMVSAWLGRAVWPFLAALALSAGSAWAQDDPPGRVGRLAAMQGQVSWYDQQEGQWSEAERNRPLTGGDRVATAADGRAELRIGSTVLRLGGATELEVLALDDERMSFQLHTGSLALRVRSREVAEEIELITEEARLRPLRSGHYRVDRIDDTSHASSWRGSLRIDDADGFVVETGQRVELWREGRSRELRHAWGSLPDDGFADWVAREEQRDERSAATRHVSPEMTGAEDLDRYGRWDRHPDYGVLWFPFEVRAGWVPYRDGRWVWVRPWGWTWVDESPWGFAPFHYGRWVKWGGRWGWSPGTYVARPVFAPALVAWVGGAHWGVSVNIGGPAIGWVPLAPRDVYVPWYRTTPVYVDRINRRPPPPPGRRPVPQVPTGPVMYGNQGVPGAVTVVPRDVLVQRQPVSRAVIEPRGAVTPAQPLVNVKPPPAPVPRAEGSAPVQRPPWPARRDPAPGIEHRRDRPQPPMAPARRETAEPERSPQPGGPAPRLAPPPRPIATPAAPVAPVAPPAANVAPPAVLTPPAAVVPPVTAAPPAVAVPRPQDRREPGPATDRRRDRSAPEDAPAPRPNTGTERPPRFVAPAPPPTPAAAAPAAPVAPVAPPAAVAPPAPAVAVPAAPARAAPPPVRPTPAARLEEEERRREQRDDERKRTPDSPRNGPRENLR